MAKDGSLKKVYNDWTLVGALTASGLPAVIYALQNILLQISYKNTFHCFFYILDIEVCPRMASLSILLLVVLVRMLSLYVVPMSKHKPFMDYY
jgi:hypothetical protein